MQRSVRCSPRPAHPPSNLPPTLTVLEGKAVTQPPAVHVPHPGTHCPAVSAGLVQMAAAGRACVRGSRGARGGFGVEGLAARVPATSLCPPPSPLASGQARADTTHTRTHCTRWRAQAAGSTHLQQQQQQAGGGQRGSAARPAAPRPTCTRARTGWGGVVGPSRDSPPPLVQSQGRVRGQGGALRWGGGVERAVPPPPPPPRTAS